MLFGWAYACLARINLTGSGSDGSAECEISRGGKCGSSWNLFLASAPPLHGVEAAQQLTGLLTPDQKKKAPRVVASHADLLRPKVPPCSNAPCSADAKDAISGG